jgi:hypothetical protein
VPATARFRDALINFAPTLIASTDSIAHRFSVEWLRPEFACPIAGGVLVRCSEDAAEFLVAQRSEYSSGVDEV